MKERPNELMMELDKEDLVNIPMYLASTPCDKWTIHKSKQETLSLIEGMLICQTLLIREKIFSWSYLNL